MENDQSTIAQGLITQKARDEQKMQLPAGHQSQWSLFIQGTSPTATDSPEERLLHEKAQKLLEAWRKFTRKLNEKLPAEQQIAVDQIPRFDLLEKAVHDAQSSLRAKRDGTIVGRSHGRLANVIRSFDDYKDLLGIIPSDDKYICLLTGTLSAFAKASMHHEETADGIDEALKLVRENMQFWRRQMNIYHGNAFMRSYIIQLYVVIFEMYTDIFVEWSSSKWSRFLNSFNSKFFARTVSERVEEMKRLGSNLEREAKLAAENKIHQLITKAEMAQMLLAFEERFRKVVQSSPRDDAAHYIHTQPIGLLTAAGEDYESQSSQDNHSDTTGALPSKSTTDVQASISSGPPLQQPSQSSVVSLLRQICSRVVDAWHSNQRQIYQFILSKAAHVTVDFSAYQGIRQWIQGGDQPCLWLQGPYNVSYPSQNTLTAGYLVSLAERLRIPVIFYFCQTPGPSSSSESFLVESLMTMTRSLILQLLHQLDESTFPASSIAAIEAALPESKNDSVRETISLLGELIKLRPRPMFCIIDNIFLLDDQSNKAHTALLRQFVDIVAPEDAIVAQPPIRTCFTTDAHSTILVELWNAARAVKIEFQTQTDDVKGEDDHHLDDLGFHQFYVLDTE
ncbi:hypothetical protein F5884DRAFT_443330 [Xylogone sp. PMI_703]|nr:hypothetical protein F5884DRAFT_443330 [Xylogone sp. PMI_703]